MKKTEAYHRRLSALKVERSSWESDWLAIQSILLPLAGRFLGAKPNSGAKKSRLNAIYDSTGTKALRTLQAGMMSGMTSPARPWFLLQAPDPELNEFGPVKEWIYTVTRIMRDVFAKSNFYRSLHTCYGELGGFGSHAIMMADDMDTLLHCHNSTIGEYYLASNFKGQIDTYYRAFDMTTGQLVKTFGIDNVSPTVKRLFNQGNMDAWVPVVHCIEPRAERDISKVDNRNMEFASAYFEAGGENDNLLSEGGFNEFPLLSPRWDVLPGDAYGTSPGYDAIGDIRQLQHEQLRKAQAIDKQTNPPLQGPAEMQSFNIDSLPGGISFVPGLTNQNAGFRPLYDVNLNLNYLLEDIRDVRDRINSVFYADLFAMLALSDRGNMTATEVAERHEEKLLVLGPVLDRLQSELLKPAIDRTFNLMLKAGLLPPPPPELQGSDLQVEYVSILAQAQRAVGTQAIDRVTGYVMNAAQVNPEVLDKFDFDQAVDEYSNMLGTPPQLVRPDDKVLEIRQQRAAQQAQQQQMMTAAASIDGAKQLSDIDTEKRSALTDILSAS